LSANANRRCTPETDLIEFVDFEGAEKRSAIYQALYNIGAFVARAQGWKETPILLEERRFFGMSVPITVTNVFLDSFARY
jgi:hypothetical protein